MTRSVVTWGKWKDVRKHEICGYSADGIADSKQFDEWNVWAMMQAARQL